MKKLMFVLFCGVLFFTSCSSGAEVQMTNGKTHNSSSIYANENYKVYEDESWICRDLKGLDKIYQKYYTKYIQYIAPNGKPITIVAQDEVTDEQLLRAFQQLSFYLEDYGDFNKGSIADEMANNKAVLVMPNGADGESKIPVEAIQGQPLYQMEVQTIGGEWYVNADYRHRDATFEEILHMVQDYGIGLNGKKGAEPELQSKVYSATMNALPSQKNSWGDNGLWGLGSKEWLLELEKEGSLEQEYLASVVDSYYGLWGAYTEGEGGMWGIYSSKTREDVKNNDPMGHAVVSSFLPPFLTYMARIDASFEGSFKMSFDSQKAYTHQSKYLKNARLLGEKNSDIIGNDEDNILMGNKGNNTLDGGEGVDVAQFQGAFSEYNIERMENQIKVIDKLKRDGTNVLVSIEILRFTDKDIKVSEIK